VYADPARGDWIAVARRDELADWSNVERAALAGFHTTLETAVADVFAAIHIRVVFDLDELRERLAIWDAKLDDGVIECVKLQCLRERPALRGSHDRIRVTRIAADGALSITVLDETGNPRAQFEVAAEAVDRVATSAVWREQFPELFAPGFVSIDRYLR
jgi:hypothetical protein